jgi:hypothetical protein
VVQALAKVLVGHDRHQLEEKLEQLFSLYSSSSSLNGMPKLSFSASPSVKLSQHPIVPLGMEAIEEEECLR